MSKKYKKSFPKINSLQLTLFTVFLLFLFAGAVKVAAETKMVRTYAPKSNTLAQVLGDDDSNNSGEGKKEEKREEKREEVKTEERKEERKVEIRPIENRNPEQKRGESPIQTPNVQRSKIEIKQDGLRQKTEVETVDGQKMKTEVRSDGRVKMEFENQDGKFKFEERVRDFTENEDEQEIEDGDVAVATGAANPRIVQHRIEAKSDFPLSVNPLTNELTVTAGGQSHVVTILPDQAVENLLRTGKVSTTSAELRPETASGSAIPRTQVRLLLRENKPVYEIEGKKSRRLFGFIPFQTNVTSVVSAETGDLVESKQSLLSEIAGFFSR